MPKFTVLEALVLWGMVLGLLALPIGIILDAGLTERLRRTGPRGYVQGTLPGVSLYGWGATAVGFWSSMGGLIVVPAVVGSFTHVLLLVLCRRHERRRRELLEL